MIELQNQQLAEVLDLGLQAKHSHWNVKGPHFIGLHELFAERAIELGGVALGTIRAKAELERDPSVIREGEQLLRSANAQVGESVAEFFPKIGLTAFLGKVSPELSAFTLGGANVWGIAAEGTGPLFQGGRLVGLYRESKAAREEAKLRYQQTILNAFREVSDALVAREQLAEMREHENLSSGLGSDNHAAQEGGRGIQEGDDPDHGIVCNTPEAW